MTLEPGVGAYQALLSPAAGWNQSYWHRSSQRHLQAFVGEQDLATERRRGGGARGLTVVVRPEVGKQVATGPGLIVAYTGDTGPDPGLAGLGRHADLYIADATDRTQRPGAPAAPSGPAMNLTAREAGEAAAAAGARRLLLSHFWPGNDRQASRAAAAAAFSGEILLADEGLEVPLG